MCAWGLYYVIYTIEKCQIFFFHLSAQAYHIFSNSSVQNINIKNIKGRFRYMPTATTEGNEICKVHMFLKCN